MFPGEGLPTSIMYCFSHCSFKYCFKYHQNATVSVPVSQIFSAFQNVLMFLGHFKIVSNTIRMHHLPSVFSFFSAVQNHFKYARTHALETLFSIHSLPMDPPRTIVPTHWFVPSYAPGCHIHLLMRTITFMRSEVHSRPGALNLSFVFAKWHVQIESA